MDNPPGQPATTFETAWRDHHSHLVGLASKMLHDQAAAEDVVQDAFSRLMQADLGEIDDVRAWLTVVVRRLSLNRIRSAYARRESTTDATLAEGGADGDPADRLTLDEQVQLALGLVLDRLTPAERTSFLLHDVFGFPFEAVSEIVGRTVAACRQLASRARRAVRSHHHSDVPGVLDEPAGTLAGEIAEQHSLLVERFIAAASGGDMAELLAILDPDVTGEARLGQGIVVRIEGAETAAPRIIDLFGPGTGSELQPVPLEGVPGIVVTMRRHVGVIRVDAEGGTIRHLQAFVTRRPS